MTWDAFSRQKLTHAFRKGVAIEVEQVVFLRTITETHEYNEFFNQ